MKVKTAVGLTGWIGVPICAAILVSVFFIGPELQRWGMQEPSLLPAFLMIMLISVAVLDVLALMFCIIQLFRWFTWELPDNW